MLRVAVRHRLLLEPHRRALCRTCRLVHGNVAEPPCFFTSLLHRGSRGTIFGRRHNTYNSVSTTFFRHYATKSKRRHYSTKVKKDSARSTSTTSAAAEESVVPELVQEEQALIADLVKKSGAGKKATVKDVAREVKEARLEAKIVAEETVLKNSLEGKMLFEAEAHLLKKGKEKAKSGIDVVIESKKRPDLKKVPKKIVDDALLTREESLFQTQLGPLMDKSKLSRPHTAIDSAATTTTRSSSLVEEVSSFEKMETASSTRVAPRKIERQKTKREKIVEKEAKKEAVKRAVEQAAKTAPHPVASAIMDAPGSALSSTLNFFRIIFGGPRKTYAWLRSILVHLKDGVKHYVAGTKLLYADMKISTKMVSRVLQGHSLTRRERRQLIRTTNDMLRMVPMSVFFLVPFLELLLPVAIAIFPGMLPSTFTTELKRQENMKKQLSARVALAGFLQEATVEMANDIKKKKEGELAATASELLGIIEKARSGEPMSNESLLTMTHLFKDDITLSTMGRSQLSALCQYMKLSSYGTDAMLRVRLRSAMGSIMDDDRMIMYEGLESMNKEELRVACEERGMRATGLTKWGYRRQMHDWLELSMKHKVPTSMLILSRALNITAKTEQMEALAQSLAGMDDEVVKEAVLDAAVDNNPELKLESLRIQEELIEEERAQAEIQKEIIAESLKEKEKEKKKEKHAQDRMRLVEEATVGTVQISTEKEMVRAQQQADEELRISLEKAKEREVSESLKPAPSEALPTSDVEAADKELDSAEDDEQALQETVDALNLKSKDLEVVNLLMSNKAMEEERGQVAEMLLQQERLEREKALQDEKELEELVEVLHELTREQDPDVASVVKGAQREAREFVQDLKDNRDLCDKELRMLEARERSVTIERVQEAINDLEMQRKKAEASAQEAAESASLEEANESSWHAAAVADKAQELQKKLDDEVAGQEEEEAEEELEEFTAKLEMEKKVEEEEDIMEELEELEEVQQRMEKLTKESLKKLERELSSADKEIGTSFNILDPDQDGVADAEEVQRAVAAVMKDIDEQDIQTVMKLLDADSDGRITKEEIEDAIDKLRDLEEKKSKE